MQTCSVQIELDRDPPGTPPAPQIYTPQDKLVGHIVVHLEEARRGVRLVLSRQWIAQAHASEFCGGEDDILLFEGDWLEPGTHRFPFIFNLPAGPYSYQGRLFKMQWGLQARVENASEALIQERRVFILEPSGDEDAFIRGAQLPQSLSDTDLKAHSRRVLGWVGAMLLSLAGVALLYPSVAATRGANGLTVAAGLFCIVLAGLLGRRSLRRGDADAPPWWKFASPPDDYEAEPGDSVSFVVELKPNFKASAPRVTALLRGVEQTRRARTSPAPAAATDNAGALKPAASSAAKPPEPAADATQVERHHFFEEAVEIEAIDSSNQAPNTYRVRFRVPSDAPYSFYCPSASLTWAIEVHVDVGTWPDWRRDFPLIVRPHIGGAQSPSPRALRS